MFQKNENTHLVLEIKDFFYNSIVTEALANETISIENIQEKLSYHVEALIHNSLEASKNLEEDKIQIAENIIVNHLNCPWVYMDFYQRSLEIVNQIKFIELSKKINLGTDPVINKQVKALANKFINSEIFQDMIDMLANFILEAKGLVRNDSEYEYFHPDLEDISAYLNH